MTQLELFAGIGGFGLAGHWAGIETVCQVEIDPFCQKVLAKNFPHATRHDDIKTFDGTQWRGVDIISGGFPCQPYSSAGKRLGTADERHLWPEMLRVIRQAQPRWVVGENVGGLISWSDGLVFEQVCADLEAEGYEVQPFVLPACAVNAPHRRDRVWFVANARLPKSQEWISIKERQQYDGRRSARRKPSSFGGTRDDCYSKRKRLEGRIGMEGAKRFKQGIKKCNWDRWTPEPPICRMDDGVSDRVDRIKSLGNAIVPQVAYQIFKAITETENLQK